MVEIQGYLQDLMTIDCEIQTNLQQMSSTTSRQELEAKSNEIKRDIREYKQKLNDMKEYCEIYNLTNNNAGLLSKFANRLSSANSDNSSTFSHSSQSTLSKSYFLNELQIQREHLLTIESRFRNAYLATQVKLDQMERETLFSEFDQVDNETRKMEMKKRHLNNQILLKKSNEITGRLEELSKELKFTESQTSGLISVLDNSSNTLKSTQQEFNTMNTAIKDGRRLLIRMNRREFTDKLLIVLCLCFFFFVVFYIVFKRLF